MDSLAFFETFLAEVKQTPHWAAMATTVEDSPWHREASVEVHTLMTINVYLEKFAPHRTDRQRLITLVALLAHDFGKPEAEETLEKKDQPGVMYRRYAGHEPISANEFMSLMCDRADLRQALFDQGLTWNDLRSIKVMIEHHLPYGLKNLTKRQNLREMIVKTLGDDEQCFYDMLRSDAAGRISDDHETKLANVEVWIDEFQRVVWCRHVKPYTSGDRQPTMYVLVGVSGAGKTTWVYENLPHVQVISEDDYRLDYTESLLSTGEEFARYAQLDALAQYDFAWKFCHLSEGSQYDAYAKEQFLKELKVGEDLVLDRMNQSRKGRGKWIQPAKDRGYRIVSVEFYVSEATAIARQATRGDKRVPDHRVRQILSSLETPWYGPEVDDYQIVEPT